MVTWGDSQESHRGQHWDTTLRKWPNYCISCLLHPFPNYELSSSGECKREPNFQFFILYLQDRAKSIVKMKANAGKKKLDEAIKLASTFISIATYHVLLQRGLPTHYSSLHLHSLHVGKDG